MLPSFYNAVSGLGAFNNYLDIVSNNMANVDTVGYKEIVPVFEDVVANVNVGINTQTNTLKSTIYGAGVIIDATQKNWSIGNFKQTGVNTDLAIQGNGLFMLQNPASSGSYYYSRNGQFTISQEGYLVNPDGLKLMGYQVNQQGQIVGSSLQPIFITPQQNPKATDLITFQQPTNLNSTAPSVTQAFDPNNTQTYNYKNTLTLYDSLGNAIEGDQYFQKVGSNQWNYIFAVSESSAYYVSGNNLYRQVNGTWQEAALGSNTISWINLAGQPTVSLTSATISPYYMISGTNSTGSPVTDWVVTIQTPSTTQTYVVQSYSTTNTSNTNIVQSWTSLDSVVASGSFIPYSNTSTGVGIGVPLYTSSNTYYGFSANLVFDPNTGNIVYSSTAGSTASLGIYRVPTSSSYDYFIGSQSGFVLGTGDYLGNLNPAKSQSTGSMGFAQIIGNTPSASANSPLITNSFITQQAANFTITASQDGYAQGQLSNVYVLSNDGTVVGVYSNGNSTPIARVALAQFQDPNELLNQGSDLYTSIYTPTILLPGGSNIVRSGMLEQSNVDIGTEYINLVTAERSYQANAKVVTSSDNVLQTTLNMVTG